MQYHASLKQKKKNQSPTLEVFDQIGLDIDAPKIPYAKIRLTGSSRVAEQSWKPKALVLNRNTKLLVARQSFTTFTTSLSIFSKYNPAVRFLKSWSPMLVPCQMTSPIHEINIQFSFPVACLSLRLQENGFG